MAGDGLGNKPKSGLDSLSMGDSPAVDEAVQAPSLPTAKAVQWNRELMLNFQKALDENPAADLMSLVPASYCRAHEKVQYRELSYAAQINLRTVKELHDGLKNEPEIDLLSAFPKNYARRIRMATAVSSSKPPAIKEDIQKPNQGPSEFRTRLDIADTARIIFRLSEEAKALLAQYPGIPSNSNNAEYLLASSLKQLIWNSPKIWESPVRGVVVRGNDGIVVKVITQENEDYTEYTSLQ
ncbi:hypothetical protein PRK78_001631 [Emydomyces testavorans]|uniref:Uncharacterized protein n=1 Tax=Emydomyces testavorans TaxID=2070801 RepID=A0AAF0DDN3_9EURO|nr:hypothetical protein PRK78_001631 [Emydomyces testavorans]